LADKGGEGIVTKLRRGFGLDDLNISTDAQGNTGLKLGKYINDNVYTDVTIGDTNDAGASINIDLTPNLTVRGQVKSDGDSSIGLVFEKDY
jgi:translocation and assembly module TamB